MMVTSIGSEREITPEEQATGEFRPRRFEVEVDETITEEQMRDLYHFKCLDSNYRSGNEDYQRWGDPTGIQFIWNPHNNRVIEIINSNNNIW